VLNECLADLGADDAAAGDETDSISQAEFRQLRLKLREQRRAGNELQYADDFRRVLNACDVEAAETDADLSVDLADLRQCFNRFSSGAGGSRVVTADDWSELLEAMGSYGEDTEYSFKALKKSCKIKSRDEAVSPDDLTGCFERADRDNDASLNLKEFSSAFKRYLKYNNRIYSKLPQFRAMVHYCELVTDEEGSLDHDDVTQCFKDRVERGSLTGTNDVDEHAWEQFFRGVRNAELELKEQEKRQSYADRKHRKEYKEKKKEVKDRERQQRKDERENGRNDRNNRRNERAQAKAEAQDERRERNDRASGGRRLSEEILQN